jgi:dihydrofolate reductase
MTGTIYVRFRIVAHFIYILEKINSLRMALTHLPAFYLIAAMSENHVIGINNRLPWHLPDEWKNFRKVTEGKAFLMGRTSYEAPDALHSSYRNIVLTNHDESVSKDKTQYATDLDTAMALLSDENEVFVLGGASVFKQMMPLAQKLFLTIVHAHIEGDSTFPTVSLAEWELVSSDYHGIDEEHAYSFSMNVYVRKNTESEKIGNMLQ